MQILDNFPHLTYIIDPTSSEILYINSGFKKVFGKDPTGGICYKELQGFDAQCDFCPKKTTVDGTHAQYNWEYHNALLNKDFFVTDQLINWFDGREARLKIAIDITDRNRALRQIEILSRFPSENPNPVLRVSPDGTILYTNDAAARKEVWSCVTGGSIPLDLRESINQAWMEKKYQKIELSINTHFYSIGIAPIIEHGYLNVYGRDITDLKQAQQALIELNADLEARVEERTRKLEEIQSILLRNDKLATIGKLSGSISHELRNPLTTINNAIFYLKTKLEKNADEKVKKHLDIIQQAVQRGQKIITDMLALSRLKVPAREMVDIHSILESTIASIQKPKNILIQKRFDQNLPMIRADKGQMQQVFSNLIINGFEAMTGGGTSNIETITQGDWIKVCFSDTGTGIQPEHFSRIFEPLFTTKATGIGLGLALIKEIIEKHEGEITFKSTPGIGTTFEIKLPIHRND